MDLGNEEIDLRFDVLAEYLKQQPERNFQAYGNHCFEIEKYEIDFPLLKTFTQHGLMKSR